MTLISATMSVKTLIVGCTSSKEVWVALENHYSNLRSNIVNLKTNLQSISKKLMNLLIHT